MREKEVTLCIWIHHIATIAGVLGGICVFQNKKLKTGRKSCLALFLASQIWAVIKILFGVSVQISKLQEIFANLHKLCQSRQKSRGILWGIIGVSILFKTGLPWMLSGKNTILDGKSLRHA